MAAAAFSRNGLRKSAHRHHSLLLWRQGIGHSAPFAAASPRNYGNHFNQSKSFSRFTQSKFRKMKEVDNLGDGGVFAGFLARKAWSGPKKLSLSVVGWYLGVLKTRPIFIKSVTSAVVFTAADVSSQSIVGDEYDVIRSVRMGGYAMFILGPVLHTWFNFMSRAFPNRGLLSTLKKMASAQILLGPAMTTVFFSLNAALQGQTGSEIVAKLRRDLPPTITNSIMYWPFCDFITFRFIPLHLQPLVTNTFSYFWTVYLTYMASLPKHTTAV